MTTTGTQSRIRMRRETAYNTPPEGDYWKIPFTGCSLGIAQDREKNPVIGVGSDPREPFDGVKDGKADLSVPIDARCFGLHLAALFGDPVTTHGAAYQHVFASGATGQPTGQAIEVMHPGLDVPQFALNTGVLYTGMEINLARSGAATAKFNVIGTDETWSAASAAGTPADLVDSEIKYFSHLTAQLKRNGTILGTVLSGSITFNNNLDAAEVVANNGLINGGARGEAELSMKLTTRFDNMTLLNDAINGTPVQVELVFSNSANEKLSLLTPKVKFARKPVSVSGPSGVQLDLEGTGFSDAVNKMLTATLTNDHDGTAYAPAVDDGE